VKIRNGKRSSLSLLLTLGFYERSGFRPFRRQVEIAEDPRLSGLAPMDAAAHVPLLAP